jgi:hypothetical protein
MAFNALKEKYPEITEEEVFCLNDPENDNKLYFESKIKNASYEEELYTYLKFLQEEQEEVKEILRKEENE